MSTRDDIKAFMELAGPDVQPREVTVRGVTKTFNFRTLSIEEVDALRLHAVGDKGGVDRERMYGNNARWVAACLVGDNGERFDVNDVKTWKPVEFVDALAKAAGDVNGQNAKLEEAAKNSDATASAGT